MYFTIAAIFIYVADKYFYQPYIKYTAKPLSSSISITPEKALGLLSVLLQGFNEEKHQKFKAFEIWHDKKVLEQMFNSCKDYNIESLIAQIGLKNVKDAINAVMDHDDFAVFVNLDPTLDNKLTSIPTNYLFYGILVDGLLYLKSTIYSASKNAYQDFVDKLLGVVADVNTIIYNGKTPLHFASQNGHEAVVAKLLAVGADVKGVSSNKEIELFKKAPIEYI